MSPEAKIRYAYMMSDDIDQHIRQFPITVMIPLSMELILPDIMEYVDEQWPDDDHCDYGMFDGMSDVPFWFTCEEDAVVFRRKVCELKLVFVEEG